MSISHRSLRPIKIQKIERRPCNRPVYNIAVDQDESYIADDVVVHNCRSLLVYITIDDVPVEWSSDEELDAAVERIMDGFS